MKKCIKFILPLIVSLCMGQSSPPIPAISISSSTSVSISTSVESVSLSTSTDTLPASSAVSTGTDLQPIDSNRRVSMRFERASLDQVLRFIGQVSGLTIIKDSDLSQEVTIISDQDITIDDAFSVLNSALAVKGFTSVRTDKTLKIISIDNAKTSELPVKLATSPDKIKPSDEYVTVVIPLSYADAYDLRKDLGNLVAKRADLSANARSNTLIITDSAANVYRIANIVKQLDTPQISSTQVRVFTLKNADASDLLKTLNDIFKQDNTATSNQNNQGGGGGNPFRQFFNRGGGGGGFPGFPGGSGGNNSGQDNSSALLPTSQDLAQSRMRTSVKFSEDDRTNSIIASAQPVDMVVIEDLVNQLDKDATESQNSLIIHLQHGDAPTLATMFTALLQTTSTAATGGTQNNRNNQQGNVRATTTAAQAVNNSLSGQVVVQADKNTNSLIFLTSPRNFERLKKMVDDLDYIRPQVMIEVIIAERTLNKDDELGVQWQVNHSVGWLDHLNLALTSTFTYFPPNNATGLQAAISNGPISAVINALSHNSKLNILSTPRILTFDNSSAVVDVGEKVPYLTSKQVTDTGSVYNSFTYQDVGITLTVTPHINPDGYVSMSVHPVISKIEDPNYNNSGAPLIANREANTNVMVKDGESVIIGGLMQNNQTEGSDKVPILGDIPILGKLFQHKDTTKEKTELMVFLTPHVVKNDVELHALSAPDKAKLDDYQKNSEINGNSTKAKSTK